MAGGGIYICLTFIDTERSTSSRKDYSFTPIILVANSTSTLPTNRSPVPHVRTSAVTSSTIQVRPLMIYWISHWESDVNLKDCRVSTTKQLRQSMIKNIIPQTVLYNTTHATTYRTTALR
jgi:hypothetical protein